MYASALSEAAILDGIRAGRTQVALRGPDDPLVELTTADGKAIGDDAAGSGLAVSAHVTGGSGNVLVLVENGKETQQPTSTGTTGATPSTSTSPRAASACAPISPTGSTPSSLPATCG